MKQKIFVYPFVQFSFDTYRPFIPICILNPVENIGVDYMALLDTGADDCVFPKHVVLSTKHNLKGPSVISEITQGVGEFHVSTWKHSFRIILYAPDKRTKIWVSRINLINCLDHDTTPPLLGTKSFLQNFKITFDYLYKTITIEFPA